MGVNSIPDAVDTTQSQVIINSARNDQRKAILNSIIETLTHLSNLIVCEYKHELRGSLCPEDVISSSINCAHNPNDVILNALKALTSLGLIKKMKAKRNGEKISRLFQNLIIGDDVVAGSDLRYGSEEVGKIQLRTSLQRNRYRKLFLKIAQNALTQQS